MRATNRFSLLLILPVIALLFYQAQTGKMKFLQTVSSSDSDSKVVFSSSFPVNLSACSEADSDIDDFSESLLKLVPAKFSATMSVNRFRENISYLNPNPSHRAAPRLNSRFIEVYRT